MKGWSRILLVCALSILFLGCASKRVLSSTTEVKDEQLDLKDDLTYCSNPLTEHTFSNALSMLSKEKSTQEQLVLAKKITELNCLKTSQLIRVSNLFPLESNRLDLAIFAYPFCFDPSNYYLLEKTFTLENNKVLLKNFISSSEKN